MNAQVVDIAQLVDIAQRVAFMLKHAQHIEQRERSVEAALRALPPRVDTQVLFPAPRGGYIDIEKFRHREWTPAVKAAGLDHRTLYDCDPPCQA
jgi:hypothetical protein